MTASSIVPSHTTAKLGRRLESACGRAISDYQMIEEGDTVLVCVSGGKDSLTLLHLLMALQKRAPVSFRLLAMNLDQKQPGFPADVLPSHFAAVGVDYRIVEADTYSIVKAKIPAGKTTCSLCSRLRRGLIYRTAKEVGATKIALGHHQDDVVHTLFLNQLFAGKLKAMPPKYRTDDGAHVVIRPMVYIAEADIAAFARGMSFPIIPCSLCGSQDNLQRQQVKAMLDDWEKRFPGRRRSVFTAIQQVVPSHLADRQLFDFSTVLTDPDADKADLFGQSNPVETIPKSIVHFSGELAEGRRARAEECYAILFVDVVDSSALYAELGDVAAMETVSRAQDIILSRVRRYSQLPVKMLGDGLMAAFASADGALQAAVAMQRGIHQISLPHRRLQIRVGVHYGHVLTQNRDYFGDTVNSAARLMEAADPGQILCSWQTLRHAQPATVALSEDLSTVWLRGRPEPLNIFTLHWRIPNVTAPTFKFEPAPSPSSLRRLLLITGTSLRNVDVRQPVLTIGSHPSCHHRLSQNEGAPFQLVLEYRNDKFYCIDQSTFGAYIIRPGRPSLYFRHEEADLDGDDGFIYLASSDQTQGTAQQLIHPADPLAYRQHSERLFAYHFMSYQDDG